MKIVVEVNVGSQSYGLSRDDLADVVRSHMGGDPSDEVVNRAVEDIVSSDIDLSELAEFVLEQANIDLADYEEEEEDEEE